MSPRCHCFPHVLYNNSREEKYTEKSGQKCIFSFLYLACYWKCWSSPGFRSWWTWGGTKMCTFVSSKVDIESLSSRFNVHEPCSHLTYMLATQQTRCFPWRKKSTRSHLEVVAEMPTLLLCHGQVGGPHAGGILPGHNMTEVKFFQWEVQTLFNKKN